MTEEIKKEQASVRSFRVTDDVMARFNAVKDDLKLNQDAALAMLINAYELEQAKEVLPDRETEIANFQMKARELVDAFLFSLQLNADAEDRIRGEVALKIESLEKTITEYQQKLEQERQKISAMEQEKAELEAAIAELAVLREQLAKAIQAQADAKSQHEKQMKDKEEIVSMLQDKLAEAEKKAAGYDPLKAERDALVADLSATKEAQKEQQRDSELQAERAARAAEKAQEAAVVAVKAEAEERIGALREQLQQAQIDAERQLRAADKESAAEIRKLEQENARLRELVASLQAKGDK